MTAPGLALVGDAALAADPLFGVGCGWAFQSGEWLADAVAPALAGEESLERGLKRYRRRHARKLRGHAFFINDYSSGRKLNPAERMLFAAAARDTKVAVRFDKFGDPPGRPGADVRHDGSARGARQPAPRPSARLPRPQGRAREPALGVVPHHVVHPGLLEGWGCQATQIKEDTG